MIGYDEILTKILKMVNGSICPYLSHIINLALINGKFPKVLKPPKIVPLYKKSDPKSVVNYTFILIQFQK